MLGTCNDCANLVKSRKEYDERHYCYIYGCNGGGRTRTVGWCKTDEDLKHQGCSFYQPPRKLIQLSLFD